MFWSYLSEYFYLGNMIFSSFFQPKIIRNLTSHPHKGSNMIASLCLTSNKKKENNWPIVSLETEKISKQMFQVSSSIKFFNYLALSMSLLPQLKLSSK